MQKRIAAYTRTALMTALTVLLSWVAIPTPWGVPFTLQTFAVALCGMLLGPYNGTLALLLYLALGAVGLPVFSGFQGSLGTLFGLTGGYLFGFLPFAFFCGLSKNRPLRAVIPLSAVGLLLCHLLGAFWFAKMGKLSFISALTVASFPYILKDVLSIFGAFFLAKRLFYKKRRDS